MSIPIKNGCGRYSSTHDDRYPSRWIGGTDPCRDLPLAEFRLHPFGQLRQLYYHTFVCAHSDFLVSVGRTNRKLDAPPIDVRHFRFAGDASANWRRREMAHVDARAERGFAGVQIWLDRV